MPVWVRECAFTCAGVNINVIKKDERFGGPDAAGAYRI